MLPRDLFTLLVVLCFAATAPTSAAADQNRKLAFWDEPRTGANCANASASKEYWRAARDAGIGFVRFAPDRHPAAGRDFLIGNADTFTHLDTTDLRLLRRELDDAHAANVPVVLTMFSLPGARWRQLNEGRDDARLWTEPGFHAQSFRFWRELASALRDHPAIVAYNPLNEPHPDRAFGLEDADDSTFVAWYAKVRGTPADLNAWNRGMTTAIRAADPSTPILLDGWSYASPTGLVRLEPVQDAAVLYAFHHYDPWEYCTYRVNKGRFEYPDRMPPGWSAANLQRHLADIAAWADRHGIAPNRIVAAEFGVDRRVGGAALWLADAIAAFEQRRWHWAFYAFRSDDWDGLDYELGTSPIGGAYWQALERGAQAEAAMIKEKRRAPNPLWDVIARGLRRRASDQRSGGGQ
jgi:hypothetical protein